MCHKQYVFEAVASFRALLFHLTAAVKTFSQKNFYQMYQFVSYPGGASAYFHQVLMHFKNFRPVIIGVILGCFEYTDISGRKLTA